MENISLKDPTSIGLFLTPSNQSAMGDADKVNIRDRTQAGPGSTPQKPLALVAKMSDSDRTALESGRGVGLVEANTSSPGIRYRTSVQHSSLS